jgi:hypothetical protein
MSLFALYASLQLQLRKFTQLYIYSHHHTALFVQCVGAIHGTPLTITTGSQIESTLKSLTISGFQFYLMISSCSCYSLFLVKISKKYMSVYKTTYNSHCFYVNLIITNRALQAVSSQICLD